ncbi:MAG: hypothetical protein J7641_06495 [Cyanobacteria bacterium SID2]|nr:hypothetical protein [Cyanobacteria bacterium SID2]MBP0003363.1 hypothetical protein [Cyanobacteria bacterium SBC]
MKLLLKLLIIALLWTAVVSSGTIGYDTKLRLRISHALWTGQEEVDPDFKPTVRREEEAGVLGVNGKRYIAYDLGQSLIMLPGDWLGTQIPKWLSLNLSNYQAEVVRNLVIRFLILVPLNAAVVAAVFWLVKLFGFPETTAALSSLLTLLGTTVFHYAQSAQQNNQVLLFVVLGYAAALAAILNRKYWLAVVSGIVLGMTMLIRVSSFIHVATVFSFFLVCAIYQYRSKVNEIIKVSALWILGFFPVAFLGRVFDYLRYGSFLKTGQMVSIEQLETDPLWNGLPPLPPNSPFSIEPHEGILGVLFSPAKSIFVYDPLLLPCLILGIFFWRRLSFYLKIYLVSAFFNLIFHIFLTCRLEFWHGDWGWAARYHVTSVHLLLIPLIAALLNYARSISGMRLQVVRAIVGITLTVQLVSVLMPNSLEVLQERMKLSGAERERAAAVISYASLDFRLGRRLVNIACLIDSSFSDRCVERMKDSLSPDEVSSLEKRNRLFFTPFELLRLTQNDLALRKFAYLALFVWMGLVFLAISMTVKFVLKLKKFGNRGNTKTYSSIKSSEIH